jgi:hypothetical protein
LDFKRFCNKNEGWIFVVIFKNIELEDLKEFFNGKLKMCNFDFVLNSEILKILNFLKEKEYTFLNNFHLYDINFIYLKNELKMSSEKKNSYQNLSLSKILKQMKQIKEKQKNKSKKFLECELKDICEEERKKFNLTNEFMESYSYCQKNKKYIDNIYNKKFLIIQKNKIVEISDSKKEIINLYLNKYQKKGIFIYNAGEKICY